MEGTRTVTYAIFRASRCMNLLGKMPTRGLEDFSCLGKTDLMTTQIQLYTEIGHIILHIQARKEFIHPSIH